MDIETLENNIGNRFIRIDKEGREFTSSFKIISKDVVNEENLFTIQKEKPHYENEVILDFEQNKINLRLPFQINIEWFNENRYTYTFE